jgi:hypothetical protein
MERVACEVCKEIVASHHVCCSCADEYLPKQAGIAQVKRTYVDLALLTEALDLHQESYTDHLTYNVFYRSTDQKPQSINIYMSMQAMNPNGFIIGRELYECTFTVLKKKYIEINRMHKHELSNYIVDIEDGSFMFIDGPESETCECEDDRCTCELYTSPKDDESREDHAYSEFECIFDEVLSTPLMWKFHERTWCIVNRDTDEIIWTPEE